MLNGIILAAGRGTRLAPLTAHHPKPLVPVAGRPLLSWGLDALRSAGVDRIAVNAHHLAAQVEAAFAHTPDVIVRAEPTLMGTGGGVRHLAHALPSGTLIITNGDALFDFDIAPHLARHRARGAMATLILRRVPADSPFNKVAIDAAGRLARIAEVEGPDLASAVESGAFTGVQIVEPALIAALPEGPGDILRTAYRARLDEGALLYGDFAPDGCTWIDVGTPDRYRAAHRAILDGRLPAPHLPAPNAQGQRVHPSARVDAPLTGPCLVLANAHIAAPIGPYATIHAGAQVHAPVQDAVIWPDIVVRAPARGTVVLPV
ncbi:MAG: NDP-sugar pyrophosphorylase family protein [Bradymonadia bacterium]|jgi:NDP-sugar pyrophosphorylase family protein